MDVLSRVGGWPTVNSTGEQRNPLWGKGPQLGPNICSRSSGARRFSAGGKSTLNGIVQRSLRGVIFPIEFKGTLSQEEHKTIFSSLRGMSLSGQSDTTVQCSFQQVYYLSRLHWLSVVCHLRKVKLLKHSGVFRNWWNSGKSSSGYIKMPGSHFDQTKPSH